LGENGSVQNQVTSNDAKIGGILVLKELIDCTSSAAEVRQCSHFVLFHSVMKFLDQVKIIKFANILSDALKINTDFFILELIADAFGHMARYSLVSHLDCIERELYNAFEWLRSSQYIHQRFAACVGQSLYLS